MKQGICYICRLNGLVQEHHLWMRSAGGEDGPVVNLCGTCHSKAHAQALNLESKGKKQQLFSEALWPRAKNIVEYIRLAIRKNRFEPDFNDPAQIFLKLTKREVALLHTAKLDAGYTNLNKYVVDIVRAHIKARFPLS